MKFLYLILLSLIIASCSTKVVFDPKADIETGDKIVQAINEFEKDKGHLPSELSQIVPKYLPQIPQTTSGGKFFYHLSDLEGGFTLCFSDSHINRGCCFLPKYQLWDCSPGE